MKGLDKGWVCCDQVQERRQNQVHDINELFFFHRSRKNVLIPDIKIFNFENEERLFTLMCAVNTFAHLSGPTRAVVDPFYDTVCQK